MQKIFYSIALSSLCFLLSTPNYAQSKEDENPCPPIEMYMAHTQFSAAQKIHEMWRVTDETSYQYNGYTWHSGIAIFDFSSQIKTAEEAIKNAHNYLSKTNLKSPFPWKVCVYARTDDYVIYAELVDNNE